MISISEMTEYPNSIIDYGSQCGAWALCAILQIESKCKVEVGA